MRQERTRHRRGGLAARVLAPLVVVAAVLLSIVPLLMAPSGGERVAPTASYRAAVAPTLAWISWTAPASYPNSASLPPAYTYAPSIDGTIAMPGGSTVYVRLSGEIVNTYGASGFGVPASYWTTRDGGGVNGAAFKSANVPDLPTNGDHIGVVGSPSGIQVQTLSFYSDAARTTPTSMSNLVMDIWSLGDPRNLGEWGFTQNFDILSDNAPPVSSYSGFTKDTGTAPYAYTLSGNEGTGTLQFNGTYSTLSWKVLDPELYAVWNIGVTSAVAPSDPSITPNRESTTGPIGAPIAPITFTPANFGSTVTYSVASGTLPAGLMLDPATGEITGTPTGPGSATVVIQATDGTGTATATLQFDFTAPVTTSTVTFDANGGTGSMAPQSSGSPAALTPNSFTLTGSTFAGWNTEPDGTGTSYADGAEFPFTQSVTLYAQWRSVAGPTLPYSGSNVVVFLLTGLVVVVVGFGLYLLSSLVPGVRGGARTLRPAPVGVGVGVGVDARRRRRRSDSATRPVTPPVPVAAAPAPASVDEPAVVSAPSVVGSEVEPVIESAAPTWMAGQNVAAAQLADDWATADRRARVAKAAALRTRLSLLEGVTDEHASAWRARIESDLRGLESPPV